MNSVAAIVSKELEQNIPLLELLRAELANVTAVAALLKTRIDRQTGQKCTVSAIGMAIRRHLASREEAVRERKFPAHLDITTRTGIYEVAISNNERSRHFVADLRRKVEKESGESVSIMEGSFEIVLYAGKRNQRAVQQALKKQKKNSERHNLACVTVDWPPITKDIPGIYFRVTRALARADISIQAFHTIGAEMTIFVRQEVLPLAYEVLSRLLNNEALEW